MQLALSSAALPDASLAELLDACARRGLTALELAAGDAHGVGAEDAPAEAVLWTTAAAAAGVRIAAYRVGSLAEALRPEAARLSVLLGAPIVAPAPAADPRLLEALATSYGAAGGRLLLEHGTEPRRAGELCAAMRNSTACAVGLAWEVRPGRDHLAADAQLLRAAGERLALIRFYGGGPESAEQTGQGVGALMARLTLARYAGPLVLTPSNPRYTRAWSAWLGRAAGWGCGSKSADPSLVQLTA